MRLKAEWAIDSEAMRVKGIINDYRFSKIQLVGQNYRDKATLASKMLFNCHYFGFQGWRFLLIVGYNI